MKLPKSLNTLIEHFESLPGIGHKTAERLAFHFLKEDSIKTDAFANSILAVKDNLRLCSVCGNVAESEHCEVCSDSSREENVICVVENVLNLLALEKTGFRGKYHVLHGVLSPLNGVNPEDINLKSLFSRLDELSKLEEPELIIATNPTMEGESTAMYIKRYLNQNSISISVTRIGRGIPTGGDIEYADRTTLDNALQSRRSF